MGNHYRVVSPKFMKTSANSNSNSSSSSSSTTYGSGRGSQAQQQPFRLHGGGSPGTQKERTPDKSSKVIPKTPIKEQTKPLEVKLHTQLRSIKRAGFNYLVECKMSLIEQQRRQEERIRKMIEEEEVRRLRKQLIPRAQLMPLFDRPFFPQRSTRPLTIPREPSFLSKCWKCNSSEEPYHFHHFNNHTQKTH